jgi:hypothetical protein
LPTLAIICSAQSARFKTFPPLALGIQKPSTEYGFLRLCPKAKDGNSSLMSFTYRLGYKWGDYQASKGYVANGCCASGARKL